MPRNLGFTDRALRVGAAGVCFIRALTVGSGVLGAVLAGLGVVLAGTAALGTCPAYLPFHVSTVGK